MGEVKWTKEQQAAIDTHDCNLLVAAAAGSGKTAVLVERIIKVITNSDNPIDIDRLLVVTFTNAAASEMRERIAEAISKEIHKNPHSSKLQRQLTLLNRASITTIHSFCLQVIKNNFHKVDLDPGFRIADDTETILLRREAIEEIFEEKYLKLEEMEALDKHSTEIINYEEVKEFINLIESYCNNKDDSELKEMILRVYNFSMSTPHPEEWLIEKAKEINSIDYTSFGETQWAKVLIRDIQVELIGMEKIMLRALAMINEVPELEPYYPTFIEDHAIIQDCIKASEDSFEQLIKSFEDIKFSRLKSIRKCSNKDIQERVKGIRDGVKKQIDKLKQQILDVSQIESIEDINKMFYTINALVKLVIEFKKRYEDKKRERSLVDFNDFEHYCLEVLIKKDEEGNIIFDQEGRYVPSNVAEELRNKYEEILIDEYQDSNMVQEVILNMISKEKLGYPNVFMVGDVKQSIYRFRQAKPELFLNKYNTYSEEYGEKYRKITLFKNFRSRREVVEGVNYIFKQIMSEDIGELDYTDREALNLGALYKESDEVGGNVGGPVELHLIDKDVSEEIDRDEDNLGEGTENDEPLTNIELEARIVARRIKELMTDKGMNTFKVLDKKSREYRSVQFKDIVILLRSTQKWAPVFMDELKNLDIPVYSDTGTGYFDTIEIQTMMALLQIIDNPRQDIPLLAVMRSPIGGFTPEEFIDIRSIDHNATFYNCIHMLVNKIEYSEWSRNGEDIQITEKQGRSQNLDEVEVNFKTAIKVRAFFEKLKIWRDKAIHMPIDEFIWYLYTETGYFGFVGAMNAGIQRQANLKILFQRARQFEKTSYRGLFNFINFINKLKKSSGDMGSAKTIGENENVVRIMSIHKSKGLEFPIVFVSAAGKNFNLMDLNNNILLHHQLGFGLDYIDPIKRLTYPTIIKQSIKKKILLESLSEEMRILYVAFTRAKEKLIITGSIRNIDKFCNKFIDIVGIEDEKIPEYEIYKGRSYLDWIIPGIMRNVYGEPLRKLAGIEDYMEVKALDHNSEWNIKIWNREEIEEKIEENVETQSVENINVVDKIDRLVINNSENTQQYNDYTDIIKKRLEFKYPFKRASEIPTVITVTELKRRMNSETDMESFNEIDALKLNKRPNFLQENKGLSPTEKGTAVHDVMQYLDLDKVVSIEEIKTQIFQMVGKEFLTNEQAESISPVKILKFFKSSLGQRMLNIEKHNIYREVPFHLEIESKEVYKDLPDHYEGEKLMLQGIIDCYFIEEGELILLDYKTDYVENGNVTPLVHKYEKQLEYYAEALEKITGKVVKEKYLYFFGVDKEVQV